MALEALFGIEDGKLVDVSGPTEEGDLILTVEFNSRRTSRPWGIPETDDQERYANLVGHSNYSHADYDMAKGSGLWG
ncbi:MAG: hypothetical protein K0U64_03460 [Actinomycetia bacterium]|nr:hypothetical protein [Actinomycetes bacterium]